MRNIVLFLALLISVSSAAQTKSSIRGIVTDAQSEFPLPGVTVIVLDTDPVLGATTDVNGSFVITGVPSGRVALKFSFIGYESRTAANLLLLSNKDLEVNMAMTESVTLLTAVTVVAEDQSTEPRNDMTTVSARSFTVEEAIRYSGALQDPSRMAQNFAGVSNASDDRNDIIIRGNSPSGVLWRMEGVDIPSPNHFSTLGTTGGPVSMLNINNLSNSDFITSAFPADYGNALAGVFDLRIRNGNKEKHEFLGQIGFNGFELGAEGPFRKGGRGSFLFNYRYSTLAIFNAMGLEFGTGTAVPQYQDFTFKLDFPTQRAGRFGVFGVGGTSKIEFLAEDATDNNLYSASRENTRFGSTTGWIGITHAYFFNERTRSNFVIAASTTGIDGKIDSLSVVDNAPSRRFGTNNNQQKYTAIWSLNSKLSARHTVRAGVQADVNSFELRDSVLLSDAFFYISDFQGSTALLQANGSWQYRAGERGTLTAGVHMQQFLLNNSFALEPRIGYRHQLNAVHTLNIGAGLHSQTQPIPVYFTRDRIDATTSVLRNDGLDFNKAAHAVLGHTWQMTEFFRVKTEVYYQHLYNIAVDRDSSAFSMLNVGATFAMPSNGDLVNEGKGRNAGVELTLERSFNKGFYVLSTFSLFDSRYTGSDGIERSTAFNGKYVYNFLSGKEFGVGKNKTMAFDTKVTIAGGRWYSPIDLEQSIAQGSEIRPESTAFSEQYTPYFRWDFKITFRSNGEKVTQQWSVDLRNLTGRENVFMDAYNAFTQNIETRYQMGFFPDVQYRIYF
ncbi:MAG: hypothetical protein RL226_2384 [Bacteroidota bacterium]